MAIFVLRRVSKYIHFVSSFIRPAEKGQLLVTVGYFTMPVICLFQQKKNYRLKAIKPVFKQDCLQTELQLRLLKFQLPSIIRLKKINSKRGNKENFYLLSIITILKPLQKLPAGLHF